MSFIFVLSYYVNGRDASLEDFLDPKVLDMLADKTDEVLKVTLLNLFCSVFYSMTSNAVSDYRAARQTLIIAVN